MTTEQQPLADLVEQVDGAGPVLANLADDLRDRGMTFEAALIMTCVLPVGNLIAHLQEHVTGPSKRAAAASAPTNALDHAADPGDGGAVDTDVAAALEAEGAEVETVPNPPATPESLEMANRPDGRDPKLVALEKRAGEVFSPEERKALEGGAVNHEAIGADALAAADADRKPGEPFREDPESPHAID